MTKFFFFVHKLKAWGVKKIHSFFCNVLSHFYIWCLAWSYGLLAHCRLTCPYDSMWRHLQPCSCNNHCTCLLYWSVRQRLYSEQFHGWVTPKRSFWKVFKYTSLCLHTNLIMIDTTTWKNWPTHETTQMHGLPRCRQLKRWLCVSALNSLKKIEFYVCDMKCRNISFYTKSKYKSDLWNISISVLYCQLKGQIQT